MKATVLASAVRPLSSSESEQRVCAARSIEVKTGLDGSLVDRVTETPKAPPQPSTWD